jgi:serine/threonine-protein kinase
MALAVGDKLGPYEIVAQIGAGGMGVVYRARDSRVGRDVAIKISRTHFTDRFEREARTVAALNHPNICTLYDVGPDYLVMELVEGESPAGPLPVVTAIDYARQIADALDAAHERGIVHRDLKPANIKVKSDGTVKVLDFGLAKFAAEGASPADLTNSPTMRMERTQAGVILGTAAYMAPEQAKGKSVDKRADIWAFGAVLYEMLTGRRAFEGDDMTTILAAVIHSEPRWDGVPTDVRRLLESCLEKDPRKRLRDIGDVWKLLDTQAQPTSPATRSYIVWAAAAALAMLAVVAMFAPWRTRLVDAPRPLVALDVDLGPDVSVTPFSRPTFSSVIISPDARRIVFEGRATDGTSRLFARRLDESRVTEIAGTLGAMNPFFSPDGQWVAFWNGSKLSKVSVEGGAVVPLTDLRTMTGGTWVDDDRLLVGTGRPDAAGLVQIAGGGGPPLPLLKLANGEQFYNYPRAVPGRRVVFVAIVNAPASIETTNIDVVSLDDGRRKTLVRGATSPHYVPSGHLIYANTTGVFAAAVDVDRLEMRGAPVPILADAAFDPITGGAQFDLSRNGTLVYRKNLSGLAARRVQWIDRQGESRPLLAKAGIYFGVPRLSPNGRRLAVQIRDGSDRNLWAYDLERDALTRLTSGTGDSGYPVWSRDGRFVLYSLTGVGMYRVRADGGSLPQQILEVANFFQAPSSIAPDGSRLAFHQLVDGTPQVWTAELHEDEGGLKAGNPVRFLINQYQESDARFSPDGRWIAYQSNESGRMEVYVRPFSPSASVEGKVQISNNGGVWPVWSPNGRELLYQAARQIMVVDYAARGGSFSAGRPRVWPNTGGSQGFDVANDGNRLAVILPAVTLEGPRLESTVGLVQNFLDELHRRAPVSR